MRVATLSIYNNSKYELSRTLSDYSKASNTVTTGKRIQGPSDDPVGYAKVMDIDKTLSQMDQLHSNIDTGLEWLSTSETTLNSIMDVVLDAKELSITAVNGTYVDEDYANIAAQVDELLDQALDLANTNVNGHYLFSGTRTGTQPYEIDETAILPEDVVAYSGNESAFTVSTGVSSRTEVSYTGTEVFGEAGTDDLFTVLIDMRNDLENNNGANLETIMGELEVHFENINNVISDVGIKTNRLETKESVISDFELTLTEQKSNIEDVDLTEAATDLALRETAYQAALSATSTIISLSLVDYM